MTNPDRSELVKLADEAYKRFPDVTEPFDGHPLGKIVQNNGALRYAFVDGAQFGRRLASSDSGVKVRELEWSPHPAGGEQALAAGLGLYRVHRDGSNWYLVPDHMGEGGKAAAQADYEARIKSALVEVPAVKGEPEPVAWVQPGKLYQYADDEENGNITAIDHQSGLFTMPLYAAPPAYAGMREALAYAERLAVVLWSKHFKDSARNWKPLTGDLIGLLTQIDNMTAALTAPGATTKSDGGVEGHAPMLAHGGECLQAPAASPAGIKPGPSDPSSTRSDVTVEDEPPENTTVGGITWHSSEEDSGPDVGISVYLGPDDRLWCGEISRRLFEEHDGPARFDSDLGAFIVRYAGKETTLIAKCADMDTGREFVEQIAEWVRKSALLDQFEIRSK